MSESADIDGKLRITSFFESLGVPNPQIAYEDIQRQYNAEGRAYHTMTHLVEGLDKMHDFFSEIEDKAAFMLAWIYHDYIYDAKSKTNEEDSATVMERHARAWGVAENTIEKAKTHVLATKHAGDKQYGDTAWLVDTDMSIVGSPLPRYQTYARDVRIEYKHLKDQEWAVGRTGFLMSVGDRAEAGALFNTPFFNGRYNTQVLDNVAWEIKTPGITPLRPMRSWLSQRLRLEDFSRS